MPPPKGDTKTAGKNNAGKNNTGSKGNANEPRVFVFFDANEQPWVLRISEDGKLRLTRILDFKDASEDEQAVLSVMHHHPDNTARRHVADEVVAVLKNLIEDFCSGLRELQPEALLRQKPWSQAEIDWVAQVSNNSMTSVVDMRSGNATPVMVAVLGVPKIVLAQTCQASSSNAEKPAPLMIVVTVPASSSEQPQIARTSIGVGVVSVHFQLQGVAFLPPIMLRSVSRGKTEAVGFKEAGGDLFEIMMDVVGSKRRISSGASHPLREAGFKVLDEPVAFDVCPDKTGVAVVGQQRPFKGAPGDIVLVPSESGKRALTLKKATLRAEVLKCTKDVKFKTRVHGVEKCVTGLKHVKTKKKANEVLATIANISEQYGHANNLYAFNAMLLWLAWCTSNHTLTKLCELNVSAHKVSSNALLAAICQTLRLPLQTEVWISARTKHCCVTLSTDGQRMRVEEKSKWCCPRVLSTLLREAMRNAGNQGTSDAWALLMNLLVIVLNNESTQLGQGAWPQKQKIMAELRQECDPFATRDLPDRLLFQDTEVGRRAKEVYACACEGRVP